MEKDITTHLKRSSPAIMTNALVNFKKKCSQPLVRLISLEKTLEKTPKNGFLRLNHRRFSRKSKCLIAGAIIAVFLISAFAFLPKQGVSINNVTPPSSNNSTVTPTPSATNQSKGSSPSGIAKNLSKNGSEVTQIMDPIIPPGIIESAQTINSTVWMKVAENAWAYYQPGFGVDSNTGLPYADAGFDGFTDWDLGCYIQACIDAQKLGLIGNNSAWDFSARINKVLTFLENRPLNNATNYPFQFYDATNGTEYTQILQETGVDTVDTGRLFVALNNLINYNSSLRQTIDNMVLSGKPNYVALVPGIKNDILTSTSIYSYYIDSGFASFFNLPNTNIILNNIFSTGTVTPYGNASLPKASITGDPLLCSVFELNSSNSQLMTLSRQVYLASEAYYDSTGKYVAFSEGNGPNSYIWEWVVLPNGTTWTITGDDNSYLEKNPIIFTKVAFSFLALYNTTLAHNMVVFLEQTLPYPTNGYYDGASNNGGLLIPDEGSNTNSLILDAALYFIQNNP
jgi:hypothetical protein